MMKKNCCTNFNPPPLRRTSQHAQASFHAFRKTRVSCSAPVRMGLDIGGAASRFNSPARRPVSSFGGYSAAPLPRCGPRRSRVGGRGGAPPPPPPPRPPPPPHGQEKQQPARNTEHAR